MNTIHKAKYGLWIENTKAAKRIKSATNVNIVLAAIMFGGIIGFTIYITLQIKPGTDIRFVALFYVMILLAVLSVIARLGIKQWWPLHVMKNSLPLRVRLTPYGVYWHCHNREIFIPWTEVMIERRKSARDMLRNPEVYMLGGIVHNGAAVLIPGGTPNDTSIWDMNMVSEIREGFKFFYPNFKIRPSNWS